MCEVIPFPDFYENRPELFWTATKAAIEWGLKRHPRKGRGMNSYQIPPTAPRWLRLDEHDLRQLERAGLTVRRNPTVKG